MRYFRLILIIFYLFSAFVFDFSFATNGYRRTAEEKWEQQGPPTRRRIESDEELTEGVGLFIGEYQGFFQAEKDQMLIRAASRNLAEVDALLTLGANVNAKSSFHNTPSVIPLYKAAEAGKEQAFRRLPAKGADLGRIPFSVALTERMQEIIREHLGQVAEEEGAEGVTDPITMDDITNVSENQKITLGQHTYLKKTIMNHILSKIDSEKPNRILDSVTRRVIGMQIISALAQHFSIPLNQLNSLSLDTHLQQIPAGMDEQTYGLIKQNAPEQASNLFKGIIRADTLRSLSRQLQERENDLQMYPQD